MFFLIFFARQLVVQVGAVFDFFSLSLSLSRVVLIDSTGGDIIVIDEAAHISLDLFYETIVPILELTNTALLAISTPLDEFNYYSKLVEQKDENGDPFFKTIKAGRVCDDCMRLPYDQMIKCDHVPDGAHWKNPHKLKRLKVLYEGDEARAARELGGIPASDFTACFQKPDIEKLYTNPHITTTRMPDCLYLTVDPNGGGASDMGCASGYFDGNDLVVSVVLFCFCEREREREREITRQHDTHFREPRSG